MCVFLAASPTNMGFDCAKVCGNNLKEMGIAVDLVNFFCLEDEHKCGRRALNLFVASVNNNENSHIKHVLPGSSIRDVLSRFIILPFFFFIILPYWILLFWLS